MADDINVVFGADTTELDAAVTKAKAEIQSIERLGGNLTPVPRALGGAGIPGTVESGGRIYRQLTEQEREAARAANELAEAQKNVGQASQRAGMDIGAMMERMAVRLVIFEAIRLALQGIKYAFDQISDLQQAQIQFNAMSDGLDHLAGRFRYLQEQAAEGLIPSEKAAQVAQTLQDYGASADQASLYVKDLGQWSHILGVDADKLAESLGRVSAGEGSLKDMIQVTHMMGEQAAAGRNLVKNLVDQENALKRLESENAVVAKSMEAVTRATEQMDEAVTRSRARGQEFLKETQILPSVQAQLPKLAQYPDLSPEFLQATGQLKLPDIDSGQLPIVMNQIRDYLSRYREGLKEIQKEEGLSDEYMRTKAPGVFSTDYIMRKAQEADEDRMRDFREGSEAQRRDAEARVTTAQADIAGTKAALATGLPQAVGAPPPALFKQFTDSLAGQQAQLKASIDTGLKSVVDAVIKVVTPAGETAVNTQNLYALFSSGT